MDWLTALVCSQGGGGANGGRQDKAIVEMRQLPHGTVDNGRIGHTHTPTTSPNSAALSGAVAIIGLCWDESSRASNRLGEPLMLKLSDR